MANNNLKISLVATIDSALSKAEINNKIKEIEGKFGKINLQIKLDDSVLKKLTDLTNKLKEFGNVSAQSGKLVEDTTKREAKSVVDLTQKYSKLISEVKKYKADGSLKSTTSTYQDDKGNGRVINTNAKGEVSNYKDIENIQRFQKQQDSLRKSLIELARTSTRTTEELRKIGQGINMASSIKQLDNLKSRMSNMKMGNNLVVEQEKLTQALKKSYDQGLVNDKFFKNFNKAINSSKNVAELNKLQTALNRVNQFSKNKNMKQDMLSQAQSLLGSGSKKLDTAGVQNLITSLQAIKPNVANATKELNKLQGQLKGYQNGAKDAAHHTQTFGDMMSQAFTKFPIWMIASTAFFAPIAGLKNLISTLYLLDERLVSIKKVLDTADMTTIFENATKAAYEYGRTIDGALQSLGEISKLGFEQADAEALNKNSMLLSTVGEFKDDAEAANYLVAIMRQYKFTVAETTDVVSSLNEVSNKTGANTLGLAQGLSKSSSAAANAGVSFNDLTGMISSTIETLKIGGNEAGNFYKTLFTRMLRGNTQNVISEAGVQVKDLNGELRSGTDILQDLGSRWSTYGSEQKNAIAQALGGVYHINKVSSLLEHQADVYKNAQYSADSYGSAQKELATFQEGLAFKTNNMKASFQELAMAIGQNGARGALVGLIESTTFLVQGFTTLTKTTNGWNIKLPLIAAGVYGVVKAFTALRLAITGVKASFGVFGIALIAVETLASAFMKSTNAGTLHSEALTDTAKKTSETSTEIQRLVGIYNELEPASQRSAEKQKELQDVLKEIQRLAPTLIDSTGKYGDKLTLNKGKTDEYIESLKKMTDEQVNQAKIANSIEISTVNVDLEGAKKKLKDLESSTKTTFDNMQSYQKKYNVDAIVDAEAEVAKRKKDLADEIIKAQNAGNSSLASNLTEELNKAQSEFNVYKNLMETQIGDIQAYGDQLDKVNELEGKKSGIEERQRALDSLTGSTNDNTASNLAQSQSLSQVAGGYYESADGTEGFTDATIEATDASSGLIDSMSGEVSAMSDSTAAKLENVNAASILFGVTSDQIAQMENAVAIVQMLSDVENLSAQQKGLLAQATAILAAQYPNLNGAISDNIDWISTQVGYMSALGNVSGSSASTMIKNQNSTTKATISQINQRIKGYQKEFAALSSLMSNIERAYETEGMSGAKSAAYANASKRLTQINAELASAQASLVEVTYGSGVRTGQIKVDKPSTKTNSGASKGNKTGSGKSNSSDKKVEKVIDPFEDKLHDYDEDIKKSEAIQKRYKEGSAQWIAEEKKQIGFIEKKRLTVIAEKKALEKLLKTGKLDKDQKKEVNNRIKELITTQEEYTTAIKENTQAIIETQIAAKIAATESAYDKEIAALQKKLDLMDEEEKKEDRKARRKELQDQLDKAKSDTRYEYVDKNGKVQLTYDKAEVSRIQKEKDDQEAEWKKEDARAALEKKIADTEALREKAVAALTKLQETYFKKSIKNADDMKKVLAQLSKDLAKTYKGNLPKHHDGGIVGQGKNKSNSRLTSLVNDLFNVKPNEQVVKALKGELMIPQSNIPNGIANLQNMLKGVGGMVQSNITNYNMSNFTIQANDAQELFKNLDMHIRMNKN